MKIKSLFSFVGLGLFAVSLASAGVLSARRNEAEPVQAEGEKWMVTICFDNKVPELSGEWGYIENRKVNFWGSNVDYYESVREFHFTGRDNFYAVNVSFAANQSVSGLQINFTENGVQKQSQDINLALDSTCNGRVYTFSFPESVSWTDGKWSVTNNGFDTPSANFGPTGDKISRDFLPDPNTESYYIKDLVVDVSSSYYAAFDPFSFSLHNWNDTYNVIRQSASYFSEYFYNWYGEAWIEFKESGTYDLFLTNEYKDDGLIDVKKHEAANDTFIYYVTNSTSATVDYIYSWGGEQQFGGFPGKSIASLVAAGEAREMTGNGVIHFQGGETAKLIYKINITKGYPDGDTMFMFNGGSSEYKSDERSIKNEHAYWWTGEANHNAAQGIQILEIFENYRNSAADTSVCNISQEDAAWIVNFYNEVSQDIRQTYVDCSTVLTHKRDGSSGEEMVPYRAVIEQLGKIAHVTPVGASRYVPTDINRTANITTIIIVLAVSLSLVGFTTLIVVRRRKHQ